MTVPDQLDRADLGEMLVAAGVARDCGFKRVEIDPDHVTTIVTELLGARAEIERLSARVVESPDVYATAGEVSCTEAREIAIRYNRSHFRDRTPGERARYSIPADPRRDDDLRLEAFIRRAELAFEEVARFRATLDAVRVLAADPDLSHEATTAAVREALGE